MLTVYGEEDLIGCQAQLSTFLPGSRHAPLSDEPKVKTGVCVCMCVCVCVCV